MKKTILAMTILTSAILISCNTPAEKVESAKENVTEATNALNKANEEYITDIENYKKETTEKIAANEKSIADFNARIENEKKDAKADYKKKIAELDQKNSDMKKKMDDYKADGKENWEKFKAAFAKDMGALGEEFKEITSKK